MVRRLSGDGLRVPIETQIAKGAVWVGDPAAIRDAIAAYVDLVGDFEIASLQVNFHTIAVEDAERSMRLFAEEVIPHVTA